jgi:lipopolysaccharide transport system permease protein
MLQEIKEIAKYHELLWVWTMREIKVRYKQSFLGGAWAILQPVSLMLIFSLIFTRFVKVPTEGIPYPIFSYTALLPWTFLTTSISFAVPSLIGNTSLLTKIYFPREIFPLSAIGASFLDTLIASLVFIVMMLFYKVPIHYTMTLIPLLLVVQILLTLGISLFASAVLVFYRDVRFVIPLLLQLWMYASPVFYPVSSVPEKYRTLYMLNPMAGVIESFRAVVLKGVWPNWGELGLAALVSLAIFFIGFSFFKRLEWQFADIV